jgi:HD-like signal output (HDOD) protein
MSLLPPESGIETLDGISPQRLKALKRLGISTLGDLIYGSGTSTNARLAGNTGTTRQVLTQTGTGSASAAPAWVDQCDIVSGCTLDGGTF